MCIILLLCKASYRLPLNSIVTQLIRHIMMSLTVYASLAPPPPVNCSSVPVYNEEGTLISINFSWAQVDVSMLLHTDNDSIVESLL